MAYSTWCDKGELGKKGEKVSFWGELNGWGPCILTPTLNLRIRFEDP